MRRRNLLILLLTGLMLLLFTFGLQAAALKAILIIEDNYDDPGMNNIAESVRMDYGFVLKFLDVIEKSNIMEVEKTLLQGETATYGNITTLIKNMKVAKDDVIFFYFSGHGGMENKKTFLATAESEFLYRDELESLVKAKPARLSLIFTDACSSSIEGLGARGTFGKGTKEKESAFVEIYKNLFYNYKGMLSVAAATEGEYAWGGEKGGAFTQSLFYEVLLQDPKLTWDDIFKEAKKKTQDKFNYMVNMGLIDEKDLKDLNKKGIKSQTPRTYSMPTLAQNVAINTETINQEEKIEAVNESSVKAVITNQTNKTIEFNIDNNQYNDSRWNWKNCKKVTLKAQASTTLTDTKPIIVFFDNGSKESLFYELTSGQYSFSTEYDDTLDLYDDSEPAASYDSEEYANSIMGLWYWEAWADDGEDYSVAYYSFNDDNTLEIMDENGDLIENGTWETAFQKNTEILTIKIVKNKKTTKYVYALDYYDDQTVMLIPADSKQADLLLTRYSMEDDGGYYDDEGYDDEGDYSDEDWGY